MKKILLTTTLALFFNCFWSFQASAGDDAKYPAYDFLPTVVYRSPKLLASLRPKSESTPKVVSQKNVARQSSYATKTKSEKPQQTNETSAAPESTKKPSSGFSFGSFLMIGIILFAIGAAYQDKMSATPAANTKPKPLSKAPKPSKPKSNKKQDDDILILSDNVTQCQASTAKGTRCKRSNDLQLKRHTFNNKNCQFAVCKQHDSKSFRPHPSVLKNFY